MMSQQNGFCYRVLCFFLVGILSSCETPTPKEIPKNPETDEFTAALQQAKEVQKELAQMRERSRTNVLTQLVQEMEPNVAQVVNRLTSLQEKYKRLQEIERKLDREKLLQLEETLIEKSDNEDDPRLLSQYDRHIAEVEKQLALVDRVQNTLDAYRQERDYIVTSLRNISLQLALLEANPEEGASLFQGIDQLSDRILQFERAIGEVTQDSLSLKHLDELEGPSSTGISILPPEVPLGVIDASSQRDASSSAGTVVDGIHRTAWISSPTSPFPQYLVLSTADGNLYDVTTLRICTTSPKSDQAALAVRSLTIFGSQEVGPSRTLFPLGTYEFPQGRSCRRFTFAAPATVRVLVIQINRSAGDPSVMISEIDAYGQKRNVE